MPFPSSKAPPLLLTRKALTVKPCPVSDADGDAASAGKYVAGLRQVQVRSAAEAKELLRVGQLHRRVFGTLANSQSSRSHAVVTIKVLRVHRGERNVSLVLISRSADLADSIPTGPNVHPDGTSDACRSCWL